MSKVVLITGGSSGIGKSICESISFQKGCKGLWYEQESHKTLSTMVKNPYNKLHLTLPMSDKHRELAVQTGY